MVISSYANVSFISNPKVKSLLPYLSHLNEDTLNLSLTPVESEVEDELEHLDFGNFDIWNSPQIFRFDVEFKESLEILRAFKKDLSSGPLDLAMGLEAMAAKKKNTGD